MQSLDIDNIFLTLYNDKKFTNTINKKVGEQYFDDMMSELYLIITTMDYEKFSRLYEDNKLENYLYIIVNNQMKKSCKNCFYRKFIIQDSNLDNQYVIDNLQTKDYEEGYNKEYVVNRVKNMMLHLHPKKAVVFNLYYFENKNYREISEITNIKLGRIALWVKSALLDIKQQLKNDNNINNND